MDRWAERGCWAEWEGALGRIGVVSREGQWAEGAIELQERSDRLAESGARGDVHKTSAQRTKV